MMPALQILSFLFIVAAGVSVALQQVLNANLRSELGSPWWAGFISYFVGMMGMLVVAMLVPGPRPNLSVISGDSWISWTGGFFGAVFIGISILTVPRLGAATVLALIVVGQMIGSIAFDHFGLFGVPQHDASPIRLAGAALLILGVVLVRF
jgi:bacterial/archaeal transporter family-2 protein